MATISTTSKEWQETLARLITQIPLRAVTAIHVANKFVDLNAVSCSCFGNMDIFCSLFRSRSFANICKLSDTHIHQIRCASKKNIIGEIWIYVLEMCQSEIRLMETLDYKLAASTHVNYLEMMVKCWCELAA
jgi:hypothetical protein